MDTGQRTSPIELGLSLIFLVLNVRSIVFCCGDALRARRNYTSDGSQGALLSANILILTVLVLQITGAVLEMAALDDSSHDLSTVVMIPISFVLWTLVQTQVVYSYAARIRLLSLQVLLVPEKLRFNLASAEGRPDAEVIAAPIARQRRYIENKRAINIVHIALLAAVAIAGIFLLKGDLCRWVLRSPTHKHLAQPLLRASTIILLVTAVIGLALAILVGKSQRNFANRLKLVMTDPEHDKLLQSASVLVGASQVAGSFIVLRAIASVVRAFCFIERPAALTTWEAVLGHAALWAFLSGSLTSLAYLRER